jgi:hypothetical protein
LFEATLGKGNDMQVFAIRTLDSRVTRVNGERWEISPVSHTLIVYNEKGDAAAFVPLASGQLFVTTEGVATT